MKLRCTHNSIRLRVRKSDLGRLKQAGTVSETVNFGQQTAFGFALKIDRQTNAITATYHQGTITVSLPQAQAEQWMTSNQVGLETTAELTNGEQLHLLVEKDFPCIDRDNEDKSDTFWELAQDEPEAC